MQLVLTPELLLEAYRQGLFPMAYHAASPHVHWLCPEIRGQLSIPGLHIPRKLLKDVRCNLIRNDLYRITINTAFADVIDGCAQATDERPETWINASIRKACLGLHERGHAHSVECWVRSDDGGEEVLAGGLYGLSIGAAFFGESMFSRRPNASKIALVHLAARLWRGGFQLLDAQFVNEHLKQFGAYEVPKAAYQAQLKAAVNGKADFMQTGVSEREIIEDYLRMRAGQS